MIEKGIYLGDVRDYLPKIDNESIDLIVTDTPYGLNYKSGQRIDQDKFPKIDNDSGENFEELIPHYYKECQRILKQDRAIYSFCGWQTLPFMREQFEKYFRLKNIIIWDKMRHGMGDLNGAYSGQYEMVLFGCKGNAKLKGDYRYPDVLQVKKIAPKDLEHPNEKPSSLLEIFLSMSSKEGDLVFDGFGGSGSIITACKALNRDYIVVEIKEDYFDIMRTREEVAVSMLF